MSSGHKRRAEVARDAVPVVAHDAEYNAAHDAVTVATIATSLPAVTQIMYAVQPPPPPLPPHRPVRTAYMYSVVLSFDITHGPPNYGEPDPHPPLYTLTWEFK